MRIPLKPAVFCFVLLTDAAMAQVRVEPVFSIWDVTMGQPIAEMPDTKVGEIACGTNGGPPGKTLVSFNDFMECQEEDTGLREVVFTYDDEQDYIALALNAEYRFLYGGTSVFAHPAIVSILVDSNGIIQGRRIFTDNRIGDYERRTAVTLMRNFKARYGGWSLDCVDIPMREGENPVGTQFIHELCSAQSPDGNSLVEIEGTFLRKKGQVGLNLETQEVNTGYFESQTRYEEVLRPYSPSNTP